MPTGLFRITLLFFLIFFTFQASNKLFAQDTIRTSKQFNDSLKVISKQQKYNYLPDTIYLINGDRITGKILSFEQGRFSIDGQGPGIISLKWHKISSVSGGNRVFRIEDIYGNTYFGLLKFSIIQGKIIVKGDREIVLNLGEVHLIYPLEANWLKRIKGDLGAGVNYTKSPEVLRINADYNLYYIVKKWRFLNNLSYMSTATKDEPTSIRIQSSLQALYELPKRWVLAESNSFNRNDELGIKSRISFGAGIGNNIVQTEVQRLLLLSGLVQNNERDIESNTVTSNVELPVSLNHTIYSFISPDLSSTISVSSYVGLTEKDRFRVDGSADVSWEFIKDISLILSFYYNYDNKTLEGKSSKHDYGTVLSIALKLK